MRDYLKGWEKLQNVKIPPIKKERIRERVIIRKHIEPIMRLRKEMDEEEGTVLLNYDREQDDATTMLKQRPYKKIFLTRLMTGEKIEITKTPFIMGKGKGCDYLIAGNATISRQHARLEQIEGKVFLEDLQSSNHTFIDGKQIDEKYELSDQKIFQLSDEKFEIEIKE